MNKIILVLGISGSGKTYWSRQWAEEDPEHRIRLNYDDIRYMFGKYWVPDRREQLVKDTFMYALRQAMYMGYNIVIDQKEYIDLVNENNSYEESPKYEIEFKWFDTPIETCISRDAERENPIGEKVIKQQWSKYRTTIIQHSIKEMLENQVVQNINLPHCIIVDMDATLCFNTNGRPFWGTDADERVIDDVPNTPVVELVKHYKEAPYGSNPYKYERNIIIVTGRSESARIGTEMWLKKYGVPYDEILMRPNGDMTKGDELKQILYDNEIKDKYYVDFVLEDSTKVVKMYRRLGLTVLQPNEGKF